ncbi:MAG: hypothetical protein ACXWUD_09300 [Methylosarcina sp.]
MGLKVVTARELNKFIRESLSPFAPSRSEDYSEMFLDEGGSVNFLFFFSKKPINDHDKLYFGPYRKGELTVLRVKPVWSPRK